MLKLFFSNVKITLRDRQALFWALMFPLMFTFIFGMFFGKDNIGGGTIAVINRSNSELSQKIENAILESNLFRISQEKDFEKSKKEIETNKISALVLIPENFSREATAIKVIYDPGSSSTRQLLVGLIDSILTQASYQLQGARPIFQIEEERTSTKQFGYFDFVLVGLIGMALMNSSIQGVSIALSKYREDKILKRITTTPLPTWKFVTAEIFARLITNFLQVSLILIVGVYIFKAHIYGNIFLIYLFSLLGALLFQSIGFTIASFSRTTAAAEGMATAIAIPMMFLAGVFFPVDQLPKWLFSIVQYLPLAPLLRMVRGIALEEISPLSNLNNLGIVAGWIIIMLALTIWRFRMNEE